MDKTCRELQSRVDSLTGKANWLGKKYDKGGGEVEICQRLNIKNDEG